MKLFKFSFTKSFDFVIQRWAGGFTLDLAPDGSFTIVFICDKVTMTKRINQMKMENPKWKMISFHSETLPAYGQKMFSVTYKHMNWLERIWHKSPSIEIV